MSDAAARARNNLIRKMDVDLRAMLPQVLEETGIPSEASLNATIGGKAAHFIDLHHEVILSPEQYVMLYMRRFQRAMSPPDALRPDANRRNFEKFQASKAAQAYFLLFLKRSYLKHFAELCRKRPPLEESEVWVGQNRASYGLLVTPIFEALGHLARDAPHRIIREIEALNSSGEGPATSGTTNAVIPGLSGGPIRRKRRQGGAAAPSAAFPASRRQWIPRTSRGMTIGGWARPGAQRQARIIREIEALDSSGESLARGPGPPPDRHGRACPGHPETLPWPGLRWRRRARVPTIGVSGWPGQARP